MIRPQNGLVNQLQIHIREILTSKIKALLITEIYTYSLTFTIFPCPNIQGGSEHVSPLKSA